MALKIRTERMELIAETAELAVVASAGKDSLADALHAAVPENWPPEGIDDALELFGATLRRDPELAGWLNWYWVLVQSDTGERTLIGCGGFTSRPIGGTVAIGYSLLPQYRGKGYAAEAVNALIARAFSFPEVTGIIAETLPDNIPSVRVLKRAGFCPEPGASEPGHIRFVLRRK